MPATKTKSIQKQKNIKKRHNNVEPDGPSAPTTNALQIMDQVFSCLFFDFLFFFGGGGGR